MYFVGLAMIRNSVLPGAIYCRIPEEILTDHPFIFKSFNK